MPAIAKILVVFAAMLLLSRLRMQLGLAIALGGIALNVWAGLPAGETAGNFLEAFAGAELWLLLAITGLIVEYGRFMTEDRNAAEIVAATRRWGGRHGRAAALMAMPAVIGLIPMPAGALFSAPFVQQASGGVNERAEWKSAVNYWFRHIWEYWWPLYPGVIVAMSVFEMDVRHFVSLQFFLTPVAVVSGYLFLVHPHVRGLAADTTAAPGSDRRALFLLLPLFIVVAAVFAAPPVVERVMPGLSAQSRRLTAVLIGLVAGLTVILADGIRHGRIELFSDLLKKKSLGVLITLTGVIVFKTMLEGSGLLPLASRELLASGIPVWAAVAALPFLAGLVTGIALGFTGVSFPLVVGLMQAEGSGLTPGATLVLAYGCGYMGMMLSPVHLCLLVTRDYFNSRIPAIYRQILPCIVAITLASLLAHVLYRALGW